MIPFAPDGSSVINPVCDTAPNTFHVRIHCLTMEARFEFIHQLLAHPSVKCQSILHKHIEGIGKPLKGNAFRKCASCFHGKPKRSMGNCRPQRSQQCKWLSSSSSVLYSAADEDFHDYLDLVSPVQDDKKLWICEQFHMDFGFARGRLQSLEKPQLFTSVDGYRAYLLIIDRKGQYIWTNLTKTKHPPIQFLKKK
jgi:hypothetical protein